MNKTPTILVVDDEPGMRTYMSTLLEASHYRVVLSDGGTDAISRIQRGLAPDLVLLDVNMPGLDGLETLEEMRKLGRSLKIVMVSCVTDTKKVVRAIQLGAEDYLTKPVNRGDLEKALNKFEDERNGARQGEDGSAEVVRLSEDMLFVCASPPMRKIQSQATLVAGCDIPVLLLGESGTGKEVIATLIHQKSPRAKYPFLKVNCAAVPGELLESELFGYQAGAFTGATKSKPGLFEQGDKGTILLDEIGEMPPALQAKLLHVLQDHQFCRLGDRSTTKVDVRVIAATNIDIQEAIASKKLRTDLYYRLNGVSLRLPPLRDRREEIPILLKQFVEQMAEKYARPVPVISQPLIQACLTYNWPGNLRELQNFVKRYIVLCDEELAISELTGGMELGKLGANGSGEDGNKLKSIVRNVKNEAEAIAITKALEQTGWKRKKAAALLGISYKALVYKVRQLELHPPAKDEQDSSTTLPSVHS
jgi:DNA-binding NtrC family response regulator